MSNQNRSLDDYNEELAREKAIQLDPYHPARRTKGEKRRNRRARK